MPPVLHKKREKKRRLDNAVADTRKILRFFVTTTAGEDETSEGNPENSNRDAVEVAPSVPAPEDEAAAEPTTVEPATAEPTTAEPARRGPVVQELDVTLDNPTDRALFQWSFSWAVAGYIGNRAAIGNFSSRVHDTIHVAQKDHLSQANQRRKLN